MSRNIILSKAGATLAYNCSLDLRSEQEDEITQCMTALLHAVGEEKDDETG